MWKNRRLCLVWTVCVLWSVGLSLPATQKDGTELYWKETDTEKDFQILDEEGLLSYGETQTNKPGQITKKYEAINTEVNDIVANGTTKKDPHITQTCVAVSLPMCRDHDLYPMAQYPNTLGHMTEDEATIALKRYSSIRSDPVCGPVFGIFACMLYFPQCSGSGDPMVPCRGVCQRMRDSCWETVTMLGTTWPEEWRCDSFPEEGLCMDQTPKVIPVPQPLPSTHAEVENAARSHVPKKDTLKGTKRQLINQSKTSIHKSQRRYNIAQLGQSDLFQGWADVQGTGSANDYCRVIGSNPSLRFLSCSLAGSDQPDHHYVSMRGFEVGYRQTWFMRDMDGDGRDDYCRCVGRGIRSYMSCMKAGARGFHGSPQQPGSQYSFSVVSGGPCFQKTYHPLIGVENGNFP